MSATRRQGARSSPTAAPIRRPRRLRVDRERLRGRRRGAADYRTRPRTCAVPDGCQTQTTTPPTSRATPRPAPRNAASPRTFPRTPTPRRRSARPTRDRRRPSVALDANVAITFSEPVTAADGAFSLACTAQRRRRALGQRRRHDLRPRPEQALRRQRALHGDASTGDDDRDETRTTRRTRWRPTAPSRSSRSAVEPAHPRHPGRAAPLALRAASIVARRARAS